MGFYSEKHVRSGRKTKYCCRCSKTINVGEPSYAIPGEGFDVNYNMCEPCYAECEKLKIDRIEDALHYDDEEDEEEE